MSLTDTAIKGKQQEITLGKYPALTLSQASKTAAERQLFSYIRSKMVGTPRNTHQTNNNPKWFIAAHKPFCFMGFEQLSMQSSLSMTSCIF